MSIMGTGLLITIRNSLIFDYHIPVRLIMGVLAVG